MNPKGTLISSFFVLILLLNSCIYRTNKEALHTYTVLNMTFMDQRELVEKQNNELLVRFDIEVVTNSNNDFIKNRRDQANQISNKSNEICDFITQMKLELVMFTEGVTEERAKAIIETPFLVSRMTDYIRTTRYFGTSNPPGKDGKAHELRIRLEQYKAFLLEFIAPTDTNSMFEKLKLLDPSIPANEDNHDWEMFYFYHSPLPGALAELSHLQVIIRQAQQDMLEYLFNKLDRDSKESTDFTLLTAPNVLPFVSNDG